MWISIFPKNMSDRHTYVSGLTGVQVALAYTVFLLVKDYGLTYPNAIENVRVLGKECSWEHRDPCFTHIYNTESAKIKYHSISTNIQLTANNFIQIIKMKGSFV